VVVGIGVFGEERLVKDVVGKGERKEGWVEPTGLHEVVVEVEKVVGVECGKESRCVMFDEGCGGQGGDGVGDGEGVGISVKGDVERVAGRGALVRKVVIKGMVGEVTK
jgi:hypothetical protein